MKHRDAEVRAHEMAHMSVGGGLTSGPYYDYQTGPDDKRYVTGGHVNIDTSKASTPEQTVVKARQIRAAALAPAAPSPQDRSVAVQATQMEQSAQMEVVEKKAQEQQQAVEDAKKSSGAELEKDEGQGLAEVKADPSNEQSEQDNENLKTSALGRKAIKAYSRFFDLGASQFIQSA